MRVTFLEPEGVGHPHTSKRAIAIDSSIVHDVMLLVAPPDEVPPVEIIREWTPLEQVMVYDWAIREHYVAAGNRVQRRARPHVSKYTKEKTDGHV